MATKPPTRDPLAPCLIQDGGFQLHVARLVHAMHVAEGCCHGEEAVGDFAQGIVDLKDLLKQTGRMWHGNMVKFLGRGCKKNM